MRIALALAALGAAAFAQSLEERLAEKMKKPFVSNVAWVTGYETALARAREEGKLVFAYFSRSYAP